jgi:hypothetical protein
VTRATARGRNRIGRRDDRGVRGFGLWIGIERRSRGEMGLGKRDGLWGLGLGIVLGGVVG